MRADVAAGAVTFTPLPGGRCAVFLFPFLRHLTTSRFCLPCALASRGPCASYIHLPRLRRESAGEILNKPKNTYDRIMNPQPMFSQIKAALDHADIEGLLAIGCPADEYNSEASLIEDRIAKLAQSGPEPPAEAQAERTVAEVWNEQFGPFSDEDLQKRSSAFTSVARKIIGSL